MTKFILNVILSIAKGKSMMKKIGKMIMIISMIGIITGCGKIKSEKQVLKNVKKKYGAAEVVSKEVISKNNVIYILRDKEDNFTYQY